MNIISFYMIHLVLLLLVCTHMSEANSLSKWCVSITCFLCLGIFLMGSMNLLWFMLFEFTIYPSIFCIYVGGGQAEKISAVYYMTFFTGFPSFLFLAPLLISNLEDISIYSKEVSFLLTGLFLSKVPLYLMHFWLPKAHVEAPTSVSMMLAALLLKVGYLGLLFTIQLNNQEWVVLVICLSLGGLLITTYMVSFCSETKTSAAYSSVTHMNLCTFSVCGFSAVGMSSSVVVAMSHSYASAFMFYLVGNMFHSSNSRMMFYNSGLSSYSMGFSAMLILNLLGNAGCPPMISFFGELFLFGYSFNFLLISQFMLSVYFLFTFYYSIYIMVHMLKSGSFLESSSNCSLSVGLILSTSMCLLFMLVL